MDTNNYARLICHGSCKEFMKPIGKGKEKFISKERYDWEMSRADYGWKCPDCGEYPCDFDDEYWEKNVGIADA